MSGGVGPSVPLSGEIGIAKGATNDGHVTAWAVQAMGMHRIKLIFVVHSRYVLLRKQGWVFARLFYAEQASAGRKRLLSIANLWAMKLEPLRSVVKYWAIDKFNYQLF